MMPSDPFVARLRAEYDHCYGCGAANPIGLHIADMRVAADLVTASFTPDPDHRGFEDVLHGGVVAALLDEILAWTAILREGVMVFTAKLEIRYRRPAPVDAQYELRGRVKERRGKRLLLEGEVLAGSVLVAEAEGLFLVARELGDLSG